MKIGLIGYGKMGKAIEQMATQQGHDIVFTLQGNEILNQDLTQADVCIEFTGPESAVRNITACIHAGVPVVSGTTGWIEKMPEIEALTKQKKGAFFYASNFSLGVNIFFTLNNYLARIMNNFNQYNVHVEEIHHTAKKDAPSGTAITILDGITENISRKTNWDLDYNLKDETIPVSVKRIDPTPGTHSVLYSTPVDAIEIKHTANSRDGFVLGAITAALWLKDKQGVFGMNDLLKL